MLRGVGAYVRDNRRGRQHLSLGSPGVLAICGTMENDQAILLHEINMGMKYMEYV